MGPLRRLFLRFRGLLRTECRRCGEVARPTYRAWRVGPPGLYCPECGACASASQSKTRKSQ